MFVSPGDRGGRGARWLAGGRLLLAVKPQLVPTVTLDQIPRGYSALRIQGMGRSTTGGTGACDLHLRFNNDSGNNYRKQSTIGNGTGTAGDNQNTAASSCFIAELPLDGNLANMPGVFEAIVPFYDQPDTNKFAMSHYGFFNANAASGQFDINVSSFWANLAQITRIDLTLSTGNWKAGSSEVRVYAIY